MGITKSALILRSVAVTKTRRGGINKVAIKPDATACKQSQSQSRNASSTLQPAEDSYVYVRVCVCVCMTHAPSCHCGTVRPFWYAQWSLCCASWLVHSKWAKLLPWLMAKEFIEPQVVAIWTVMSVASAKGGRNWLIWHRQRHSGCVFRTSQVAQVVSVGCFCLGSICIKFAYEFRVDKLQAAHSGRQQRVAAAA